MLTVNLDLVEPEQNATAGGPIRVAFPFHSAVGTQSTSAVLFGLPAGSMLASQFEGLRRRFSTVHQWRRSGAKEEMHWQP
jgi:hypothetical protein